MSGWKQIQKAVMNLGVKPTFDVVQKARVVNYNIDLSVFTVFIALLVVVRALFSPGLPSFFYIMGLVVLVVYSFCLYLNYKSRHNLSVIIANLTMYVVLFLTVTRTGSQSQLHLFIVSLCVSPLLFLHNQRWLSYLMLLISFALYVVLAKDYFTDYTSPLRTPEVIYYSKQLVIWLLVPATASRLVYVFRINDFYLNEYKVQGEYLRKIIDLNPSFIFAKNRRGEFTLVNQAVADAYGTTVDELVGKTDADFNSNTAEVEHFRNDDLLVMNSGQIKFIPLEEITDASGKKRFLQTVKTPILNVVGAADELLGVATDITERMHAQQELEKARDDLRNKNEELKKYIESNLQLENFAYVASHDLKEPLRSMIGYAQLLEKRYSDKLDTEAKEFLCHIIASTRSMNKLIGDLLMFSRANTEKIVLEELRMVDVSNQVLENLHALIKESSASVRWHSMPGKLVADRTRLVQLFQNLISNAVKFTAGSNTAQIDVFYEFNNNKHWFEVRDNGIGIDPRYHEKIFLLFSRIHNRSEFEGSGIGLATCKKIVEQHNGTISVKSEPGKGSSFVFSLAV